MVTVKKYILCLLLIMLWNVSVVNGQPNFVVIISDDMGWTGSSVQMDANLSGSKSDFYFTPSLEALAQAGTTFSQAYSPAPKCSPSRCSILTGRTTSRTHFTNTDNAVISGNALIAPTTNTSLDGADTTLAEWLHLTNLNYTTAHYGKWHLGSSASSSPSSNGFDFSDGSTANSDGNNGGGTVQTDPKHIFDLTNKSISFIQDAVNDNKPFYLQLSHYGVHVDIEARQSTIDLYNDQLQRPPGTIHTGTEYAAMTEDTDTGIGQLLDSITSLGIDGNTYVIFMSDNGGQQNVTSNSPLFRGKAFISEGGIRVPFIIKGPSILANTFNTTPIVAYDLFPTIAALVGSNVPLPNNLDGMDISNLFSNNSIARTESIYFHSPNYASIPSKQPRSVAVEGKYKLIVNYDSGSVELFDLDNDIGESTDVSVTFPEITTFLKIKLRDHLKSVNARMPSLDPSHMDFSGTQPDVDQDGLNDEWEFVNLLSYHFGANDDPDNDTVSNLDEFNAGTDPLIDESAALVRPCLHSHSLDNSTIVKDETIPAMNSISSSRSYDGNITVNYSAGQSILLSEGFSITTGSVLSVDIESCP